MSKRPADKPTLSDGKKSKLGTERLVTEEKGPASINIEYYPPEFIFYEEYTDKYGNKRVNKPEGMAGPNNSDLAKSFYHSRYTAENKIGTSKRMGKYKKNAGALQLYKRDRVTKYSIPGKGEKEYTAVAKTIFTDAEKHKNLRAKINSLKNSTEKITFGHTEIISLREALNDLRNLINEIISQGLNDGRNHMEIISIREALDYLRTQLVDTEGNEKTTFGHADGISFKNELNSLIKNLAKVDVYKTTFGHTEKILMRKVLDDLIEADRNKANSEKLGIPPKPSDYNDKSPHDHDYKVFNNLINKANMYKQYLESKELIVKMWSERPPCDWKERIGGDCSTFINDIYPEGSQYGYIVEDYNPEDEDKTDAVRDAFERFVKAYQKYEQQSNNQQTKTNTNPEAGPSK
ncbi:uncharacterized protein LOC128986266 [Macrosteles quadrilineatus]|uniref:uncharacterized protein LOC128986266 n=1 Tax=Macrosteles quadrilineatus TaxID=74068 RepID=UPI0023E0BEA6|nr:uncharacterized protein LOC128986266 [Macrosteles quadrilineatus]XP_054262508.1 uncharacterized protein LOC128986266 [Macrosteles quadrilineatus]